MSKIAVTRRTMLKGTAGVAAGTALGVAPFSVRAAAPEPAKITPELIAAATKEGKISWYTSVDLPVAEKVSKAFEARYAGIKVLVQRTGGERVYQRVGQEYTSKVYAVDVVQSSDAAHFIVWKREGWLAPYLPEEVATHYAPEHRDPDGMFATWRMWLCVIAYNTKLVKPEEAPKSYADLLLPRWTGKMVKAHPGYSGTIMTATFQMARDLGWGYFEKLAQQKVMQVQSSADPPKKLSLGEREVMADGNEYNILLQKEKGEPVEVVYPAEGAPLIIGPAAVMKNAPNPNAARLFHNWSLSAEAQQLIVDVGALRSAHALVKEPKGRKPLSEIKTMKDDAAAVEREAESIKARYTSLFKV